MRAIYRASVLLALGPLLFSTPQYCGARAEPELRVKPKIWVTRGGAFQCNSAPALLVGRSLANSAALAPLQERIRERFGSSAAPVSPDPNLPGSPFILVGLAQDHPALRKLAA